MISCIGPNPSLDFTMRVDELRVGGVNRSPVSSMLAGGKAANVARVLSALKTPAVLIGPLGRNTGETVRTLAAGEGLKCHWTESSLPTRSCLSIVQDDGLSTEVNGAGELDDDGVRDFLTGCREETTTSELTLVSGSMPNPKPVEMIEAILTAVQSDQPIWLDTSGPALAHVVKELTSASTPDLVKVNLHEAVVALGTNPEGGTVLSQGRWAARQMQARTDATIVITLGSEGAVLDDGRSSIHAQLHVDRVVSATGSGDSLLAGLAAGMVRGLGWPDALALGVACGASNAMHLPAGQIDVNTLDALLADVERTVFAQ